MAEFIDTMHQFAGTGVDEKLVFLFKVYDLDGKWMLILWVIIHSICIYFSLYNKELSIYLIKFKGTNNSFH